jgi:hypothetical protein
VNESQLGLDHYLQGRGFCSLVYQRPEWWRVWAVLVAKTYEVVVVVAGAVRNEFLADAGLTVTDRP